MASNLVRARCEDTGHIAALPKAALDLGMCPGWVEAPGPPPSRPKPAAFPRTSGEKPETEDADSSSADPDKE